MTVAELKGRMTYREALQWADFEAAFGFGELRADLRAAMVCQTAAAIGGAKTRVEDWMPAVRAEQEIDAEADRRARTPQETAKLIRDQLRAAFGRRRNG